MEDRYNSKLCDDRHTRNSEDHTDMWKHINDNTKELSTVKDTVNTKIDSMKNIAIASLFTTILTLIGIIFSVIKG